MLPHGNIQIVLVRVIKIDDAVHSFDVLRRFLFHYVEDIIDGDDADQAVLFVNNGHRQKVVFFELFGNLFLVVVYIQPHIVGVHDVLDFDAVIGYDKRAQRNDTDEFSACVLDIAGVNRLGIHSLFLNVRQSLSHGHLLLKADVFRRHKASRASVRVVQKIIDELPLVLWRFFENLIDQIGRKFLQNIDFVVEVKFAYDIA